MKGKRKIRKQEAIRFIYKLRTFSPQKGYVRNG